MLARVARKERACFLACVKGSEKEVYVARSNLNLFVALASMKEVAFMQCLLLWPVSRVAFMQSTPTWK